MMKKRMCMSVGFLMMTIIALGQSNIQEINAIKRNKSYIYAEATLATEKEASDLAQELLVKYIEDYLEEDSLKKSYPNYVVKDIVGKREKLSMKRGEMIRVFLYVNKEDIIPAKNLMTLQKEESKQRPEKNLQKKSMATRKENNTKTEPPSEMSKSTTTTSNQPSVVTELLKALTAKDALATLDRLKSEYKVKRYGSYEECKNISTAYWLILSDNNKVCAILGKGQDERIDYVTNTYSSLKAYSGKSAVWFTLNDN